MPVSSTKLPKRFAYLAKVLADNVTVLSRLKTTGIWPSHLQVNTELREVTSRLASQLANRNRRGQFLARAPRAPRTLTLTLSTGWPFTVRASEQLVIGYLAASTYAAFNEWEIKHEAELDERLVNSASRMTTHEFFRRTGERNFNAYRPKLDRSAAALHEAYKLDRLATDLPRIASFLNLNLALTVTAAKSDDGLSAMAAFITCCGGDRWLKAEIFNHLFEYLAGEIYDNVTKLYPDKGITKDDIEQHLVNIDLTVSAFVGLQDPWGLEGPGDVDVAKELMLDLAKYLDELAVDSEAVSRIKLEDQGTGAASRKGSGKGDNDKTADPSRLPQLVQEVMSHSDVSDAIQELASEADGQDDTGVGTQAGTSQDIIHVMGTRAPTGSEQATARELAQVISQFNHQARPGEVSNVDEGRLDPLAWFLRKVQAPGDLNFRKRQLPDRRPEFSMALAVCVDTSGSMGYGPGATSPIDQVSSAAWTLVEGFRVAFRQGSKSRVWTAGFNTVWEPVHFGDQVPQIQPSGGTNPESSIKAAVKWLNDQKVAHRFLVVYTDDEWSHCSDDMLDSPNKVTRVMFVPEQLNGKERDGFEVFPIRDPYEMVGIFKKMVHKVFRPIGAYRR